MGGSTHDGSGDRTAARSRLASTALAPCRLGLETGLECSFQASARQRRVGALQGAVPGAAAC